MTTTTLFSTIADLPRHWAAETPDNVALSFEGRDTPYRELNRRAHQVANGLAAEGCRPESRVALIDKNSDLFFEVFFGAAQANEVLVAVNWRLAPPEVAYVINDAQAEVLFVGEEFVPVIERIRGELKTVRKIIALQGGHAEWEPYERWRDRQSDADPQVAVGPDDVAIQMYTSGTTGHPKGAQLTNKNLFTLLPMAIREWGTWSPRDVNLVAMPLFHIAGSGWGLVGLAAGAKTVIMRDVIPPAILAAIPEHGVTKALFVPAVLLFLLQTPGVQETDFSTLELIAYGASPIPLDLLRNALATFKCGFAQLYGLTETTGAVTYLPPEDHDPAGNERMRSCGKALSTCEIRVVDAEGNSLPAGQVGEIIVRSDQVMKGYWNLPQETAGAIRGEWFHTGDAGYLDADGYLYIHDRVKDMIVSGGENVYPAEVESALFGHPAVADVAVIGVPDDRWGEAVKAIVVKKPGADVTPEELIAFARERVAGYKAPKSVDFAESLPRNPSGKILKRELREPYWAGRERRVN
ncbi:MAG: fatty acid--CoA ligase [Hyphomicrobiales bacterium]